MLSKKQIKYLRGLANTLNAKYQIGKNEITEQTVELNGVVVKEIPADAKGNLHLVADFSVLEGEIYTITFDFRNAEVGSNDKKIKRK